MAEETTGRKSKLRREGEDNPPETSTPTVTPTFTPQGMPQTVAPQVPAIAPEVRDELTALMQDLLLKTHELSFEYSTMECEELSNCPLGKKSKELFRVVKKLNELVKKMGTPTPTGYVR
jgi:hypothetical protein